MSFTRPVCTVELKFALGRYYGASAARIFRDYRIMQKFMVLQIRGRAGLGPPNYILTRAGAAKPRPFTTFFGRSKDIYHESGHGDSQRTAKGHLGDINGCPRDVQLRIAIWVADPHICILLYPLKCISWTSNVLPSGQIAVQNGHPLNIRGRSQNVHRPFPGYAYVHFHNGRPRDITIAKESGQGTSQGRP